MKSAVTISLVPEARGGPFVFWDDLAQGCAHAAELGFDAVEIFPPSLDVLTVAGVKGLLGRHGLQLAAIGTGAGWVKHKLRFTDPDATIRKKAIEFAAGIVRLAGELGAPAIIGSMQGRYDGIPREQAIGWLAEALESLAELAGHHDQNLLFEPLNRYETNVFNLQAEAATFAGSLKARNVRILCDLFHMNIEEISLATTLRQLGPMVGHVHWADSNRRAMGLGHTDPAPIVTALRENGYTGYISAEVFPWPDSVSAARQSLASYRRAFGF